MGSRKIKRRKSDRVVKIHRGAMTTIENRIQRFRDKFGREPGLKDPIFFNPDSLMPEPFRQEELTAESEAAMVLAGVRPEIVYAHRKTGLIVTSESYGKLPKSVFAEWEAAVAEYFEVVRQNAQ